MEMRRIRGAFVRHFLPSPRPCRYRGAGRYGTRQSDFLLSSALPLHRKRPGRAAYRAGCISADDVT